jgi:hypothetical protein
MWFLPRGRIWIFLDAAVLTTMGSTANGSPPDEEMKKGQVMDDTAVLRELNDQFIEAWRQGSWELLEPILTPTFAYMNGATGEPVDLPRYIDMLRTGAQPGLQIDQLVIHVVGDAAVVSARSTPEPGRHNRYVDSYIRHDGAWRCMHATVWPLR